MGYFFGRTLEGAWPPCSTHPQGLDDQVSGLQLSFHDTQQGEQFRLAQVVHIELTFLSGGKKEQEVKGVNSWTRKPLVFCQYRNAFACPRQHFHGGDGKAFGTEHLDSCIDAAIESIKLEHSVRRFSVAAWKKERVPACFSLIN